MGKDSWVSGVCNLSRNDTDEEGKGSDELLPGIKWEEIAGDFSFIETKECFSITITFYGQKENETLPVNPWNAEDDAAKR